MMGPTRVGCMWSSHLLGEKMNLFDCQQSYNVLVLRVPGLEEGVEHCDRWPEQSFGCWARRARAGQTYPPGVCTVCCLAGPCIGF